MPWLGPLLIDRDEHGQRRFTDRQAEDFLAALLLSEGVTDPTALPDALVALLYRFSERAQIPKTADAEEANQKVAEYFERNPVPPDLRRRFLNLFRDALTRLDPDRLAEAYAALGEDRAPAMRKDPPGEGPTGALAFFSAHRKLD